MGSGSTERWQGCDMDARVGGSAVDSPNAEAVVCSGGRHVGRSRYHPSLPQGAALARASAE
jgi:hypothetical protein